MWLCSFGLIISDGFGFIYVVFGFGFGFWDIIQWLLSMWECIGDISSWATSLGTQEKLHKLRNLANFNETRTMVEIFLHMLLAN